ncbi:hypothetical protein V8G54_031847, partial [Vigna mungo]
MGMERAVCCGKRHWYLRIPSDLAEHGEGAMRSDLRGVEMGERGFIEKKTNTRRMSVVVRIIESDEAFGFGFNLNHGSAIPAVPSFSALPPSQSSPSQLHSGMGPTLFSAFLP